MFSRGADDVLQSQGKGHDGNLQQRPHCLPSVVRGGVRVQQGAFVFDKKKKNPQSVRFSFFFFQQFLNRFRVRPDGADGGFQQL